ncbi:DUF952 domain-containing protein [Nocardioides kongjuensis]|uniref:Uncharacterized protein (DUF952 family) n=1 Tax=Nocardioides kongjuensis TaxID=349522 RepID=A0A852RR07_9ACTN|nr:DUF952 domain-containing protein [Nocardioides kongjuensis]NYD30384.1 uncharacterized protein (DUF952 family) [Nocardioides kongjuensis]
MTPIFHLALLHDWEDAQRTGAYTVSTRGRTLAEEGFIHASRADQWTGVRDRFYADVAEPMVLLQIDPALLDVPVIDEEPFPGATETFPHIYGPLPVTAVVKTIPLDQRVAVEAPAGRTPSPAAPAAPVRPDVPQESFTRAYFREVFFNVAVVSIVLLVGTSGMALGATLPGDAGPAVGGLLGLVLGILLAVRVYRYRHPRPER